MMIQTSRLYLSGIAMTILLIFATLLGIWQAMHPISADPIEVYQPVPTPVVEHGAVLGDYAESATLSVSSTGVAGASVSRTSVDGPIVESIPSPMPSYVPTGSQMYSSTPTVVQPVRCALGPTQLPGGSDFCQPR